MTKLSILHIFCLLNLALTAGLLTGHQVRDTNPPPPPIERLSVSDAAQALVKGQALFVDARSREVYLQSFIPTALSYPVGESPSPMLLEKLRSAPKIIVYCDGPGCNAGVQVARDIKSMKFGNVYLLEDGFPGWLAAGNPVSRVERAPETKEP